MHLMQIVSEFGRKLNLNNARKVFDRAVQLVGGEDKLAEVFKDKRAYSVSSQAALCDNIAHGVPVAEIAKPDRAWYSFQDVEAIKAAVGREEMRSLTKRERAFYVADQGIVGARQLIAQGKTVPGVDLAKYAKQQTRREAGPGRPSEQIASNASKPAVASSGKVPTVTTPAKPTPQIDAKAAAGAAAWQRYVKLQSAEKKDWNALCVFRKKNFAAIETGRAQCIAEFEQALKSCKTGMEKLEVRTYIDQIKSL